MAGKKKSTKKAAEAPASRSSTTTEGEKAVGSGKLHRAVWHKGRMYDPKRRGDVEAFASAVKSEKEGAKSAQRLADKGVITGFGTRGRAKGKKGQEAEAPAGASYAGDELGGGLDSDEDLTDEEQGE